MLRCVVTGASSGIGLELSRLLCRDYGARVIGVGRNEHRLRELEKEFSNCFSYILADLSSLQDIDRAVEKIRQFLTTVDILVNNAGFGLYKPILEHRDEEVVSMAMANFASPIILVRRLLPLMPRGSTVVMVITAGVHVLMRDLPLYGATKIALHYSSEALRYELERYGINLLAVYPGAVKTEFHRRAGRELENGLEPIHVARAILKAVEKKKKRIYIPQHLSIARIFGPYLPPL